VKAAADVAGFVGANATALLLLRNDHDALYCYFHNILITLGLVKAVAGFVGASWQDVVPAALWDVPHYPCLLLVLQSLVLHCSSASMLLFRAFP
jgi:hypothetical protein